MGDLLRFVGSPSIRAVPRPPERGSWRSDEFRPRQLSISESQPPSPPVCDAALEVTMCPIAHSFQTSGGVAATREA